MTDDRERLVEVVARVIARAYDLDPEDDSWDTAQSVLAAIDASGTHKVIPVWLWDDMRDAYLAETTPRREDCDPDHRQNR